MSERILRHLFDADALIYAACTRLLRAPFVIILRSNSWSINIYLLDSFRVRTPSSWGPDLLRQRRRLELLFRQRLEAPLARMASFSLYYSCFRCVNGLDEMVRWVPPKRCFGVFFSGQVRGQPSVVEMRVQHPIPQPQSAKSNQETTISIRMSL